MPVEKEELVILGGGITGLAARHYASMHGLRPVLFEKQGYLGGNCSTFSFMGHRFDSGAHRLHGKDRQVARAIRSLLGARLRLINSGSRIYRNGRYIAFPISPLSLFSGLEFREALGVLLDISLRPFRRKPGKKSFREYALSRYGSLLPELFLFSYSEKLWGLPCSRLSCGIAGDRIRRLGITAFFSDLLACIKGMPGHYEGAFYYPVSGINGIADAYKREGKGSIFLGHEAVRLRHSPGKIEAVHFASGKRIRPGCVISTIPVTRLLEIMSPPPSPEVMSHARRLRFRDVLLVAVAVRKRSLTKYATIYVPDQGCIFTRVYEPKVRSGSMSPEDATMAVAEIPCWGDEYLEPSEVERAKSRVVGYLAGMGLFSRSDVYGVDARRIYDAYPVIETGTGKSMEAISEYLSGFSNLVSAGRNGMFVYAWIHDMVRFGRMAAERCMPKRSRQVFHPGRHRVSKKRGYHKINKIKK